MVTKMCIFHSFVYFAQFLPVLGTPRLLHFWLSFVIELPFVLIRWQKILDLKINMTFFKCTLVIPFLNRHVCSRETVLLIALFKNIKEVFGLKKYFVFPWYFYFFAIFTDENSTIINIVVRWQLFFNPRKTLRGCSWVSSSKRIIYNVKM